MTGCFEPSGKSSHYIPCTQLDRYCDTHVCLPAQRYVAHENFECPASMLTLARIKGDRDGCDHDRFAERGQNVSAESPCGQ